MRGASRCGLPETRARGIHSYMEPIARRALPALLLAPFAVEAQGAHSLIGTWEGEVVGFAEGRRTLSVTRQHPDGTFEAVWGRDGAQRLTLRGETVPVMSGNNNPIQLSRAAPNRLEGSFTTGGGRRSYPLVLTKR
jgi:hypothetical protein